MLSLSELWRQWRWQLAQSLEQRWWTRYTGKKRPEEYLTWKRSYWQNYIQHLPASLQYKLQAETLRILDVGCGPAGIFIVLQNHCVDCVDPLLPRYIHLEIFDPGWYPHATFHARRAEEWQPPAPYDIIFCTNALDHMKDWKIALQRMASWLKAGGFLVLSVDISSNPVGTLLKLLPFDLLHPHKITHTHLITTARRNSLYLLSWQVLRRRPHAIYTLYVMRKVPGDVVLNGRGVAQSG